jgi:hypothetical protein
MPATSAGFCGSAHWRRTSWRRSRTGGSRRSCSWMICLRGFRWSGRSSGACVFRARGAGGGLVVTFRMSAPPPDRERALDAWSSWSHAPREALPQDSDSTVTPSMGRREGPLLQDDIFLRGCEPLRAGPCLGQDKVWHLSGSEFHGGKNRHRRHGRGLACISASAAWACGGELLVAESEVVPSADVGRVLPLQAQGADQ